jgi:hypothetical protein
MDSFLFVWLLLYLGFFQSRGQGREALGMQIINRAGESRPHSIWGDTDWSYVVILVTVLGRRQVLIDLVDKMFRQAMGTQRCVL